MSFWSIISSKIKEVIQKMVGARTVEQKLHVAPIISSQMEEAIQLWTDMYKNEAPWLHEPSWNDPTRVVSLGLPAMIASEKARMALIEFNSEITVATEQKETILHLVPDDHRLKASLDFLACQFRRFIEEMSFSEQ